jgi:hypothetical protein
MYSPTRLSIIFRGLIAVFFFTLTGSHAMAATTNPPAPQNLIEIVVQPSSSYTTLQLKLPQASDLSTVHVVLNGKEITSRVVATPCSSGLCMSGTISEVDGLQPGKNVVYATAKSNSGNGLMSGRTRFSSDGAASTLVSHGMLRNAAQLGTTSASGSSGFLPPTVSFQVYYGDGLQIGGTTYITDCTNSAYTLFVFDRQTLTQIPNQGGCMASGGALATSLGNLTTSNPGALAVVTAYGVADNQLDTSLMGGSDHTKDSHPVKMYVAIGVVGAAPGSAYENFNLQVASTDPQFYTPMYPFATGVVQEDANGNYNFDSSDVLEYTIDGSPTDTATAPMPITISAFQSQMQKTPGLKGYKFTAPSVNATGGYWLLIVQRDSPWAPIKSPNACNVGTSPGSDGMIVVSNCGGVYPTGDTADTSGKTREQAYNNLAAALNNVGPYDLAFLTKWGAPTCCIDQWSVVGNGSDTSNGFLEFSDALQKLGGSGRAVLFANNYGNQGFAFIGSFGIGDTLTGNAAISSTTYSASGQAGYLHGTLARNLNGLFQPYQSSQQASAEDDQEAGPDYTITKLSTLQPVPWPSNESKLPDSDTLSGQQGAYSYISYTLITQYYIKGATGPYLDDIHYFFTGSNSNYINYHYFDAINLPWPGGSSPNYTWVDSVTGQSVTFSLADFKAVASQVSQEVVYLTNVVNFMLTGPVNMKDMIASGNANAGLALTGAASNVLASSLKEQASTTPAKFNVSNILSLVSGITSAAAAVTGFPDPTAVNLKTGLKVATLIGGVVSGSLSSGAAISGGFTSGGKTILPSRYTSFVTTIGQLANGDLQNQLSIGFDTSVDSILADWGKLSVLGPKITDTSNAAFYSPNQVAQNTALQMLTQASERSFYMSLVPTIYSVDFWPKFYGSGKDDPSTNPPDIGIADYSGDSCPNHLYAVPAAAYSYEVTPTPGGYQTPAPPPGWWTFWKYPYNPTPADYYVIRGALTGRGSTKLGTSNMDPNLAQELFSPSGLNIPFDLFVAPNGPMSGHFTDMSQWDPTNTAVQVVNEITGYASTDIAPCARIADYHNKLPSSSSSNNPQSTTTTSLSVPASSVLGESLTLKASVATTDGPVTAGSVNFMEGTTILGTTNLDAAGTASVTLDAATLGQHSYQAFYVRVAPYYASDSNIGSVMVFANSPELSLSLASPTLDVSYGAASTALTVQIASKYGATGPVSFSCSGLPIGMACNFSPAQLSLSSGNSASTSLTIKPTAVSANNAMSNRVGFAALLPLPLVTLLVGYDKRRRLMPLLCFGMLAVAIGTLAGCSTGSNSSTNKSIREAGTKTILVTATSGAISKSLPLIVNIQ